MQTVKSQKLYRLSRENNSVIIDANWYLPTDGKQGAQEYQKCHIKDAQFFDIDACCDTSSGLPHSLPEEAQFQETMRALGVHKHSHVFVYDRMGYFSAPRLYWMLRYFGHGRVAILDGGLKAWIAEGLPTTDEATVPVLGDFVARANPSMCIDKHAILERIGGQFTLIDARAEARFLGQVPEPRPGLRAGHIPGSVNVPYDSLFDKDSGFLKSPPELQKIMHGKLPRDKDDEVICSCGSGVTACAIVLALEILGYENVKLYDGSWAEWGAEGDSHGGDSLPIETI